MRKGDQFWVVYVFQWMTIEQVESIEVANAVDVGA